MVHQDAAPAPRPHRRRPSAAGAATEDREGLLLALVHRFAGIVGDKAAAATFHFAAIQEGSDIGRAHQNRPLRRAVEAAAELLGHQVRLEEDAVRFTVLVERGPPTESDLLQAIVTGLYEGVLRGHRGAVYACTLEREGTVEKLVCTLGSRG